MDSNFFFGLGRSQSLPYLETKLDNTVGSEKLLSTTDNADTGFAREADSKHS